MVSSVGPLQLQRALDALEDVFFVFTEEGEMLQWNRRASEVTGYSDEEISEMHPTDFVVDEERTLIQSKIEEVLSEGRVRVTVHLRTADGRLIPCEFTAAILEESETTLICGTGRLLSEAPPQEEEVYEEHLPIGEEQAEEGLPGLQPLDREPPSREQPSEESFDLPYQRLFETSQDGLLMATPTGEIINCNPALCQITGYSREELIGRQASTLYDDSTREKLIQALQNEGRVVGMELPLLHKDGETRICQVSATVWTDSEGKTQAVQSVVRDVTKQRTLMREILRVQEEERRRIGQDLHDGVASQLSAVLMKLDVLATRSGRGDLSGSEVAKGIEDIQELLRECTEDLRRLSRGLSPTTLSDASLMGALEKLVENTSCCSLEVDDDVALSSLSEEKKKQIYWIAREAVANAHRHANPDEIQVRLTREKDGTLTFTVEDDGAGFEVSDIESEGIGLQSMRHRAEVLNADLSVESSPGEGTRVRCRMPA